MRCILHEDLYLRGAHRHYQEGQHHLPWESIYLANILNHLLYSRYLSIGPSMSLSLNGMCLGTFLSALLVLSVPKSSSLAVLSSILFYIDITYLL